MFYRIFFHTVETNKKYSHAHIKDWKTKTKRKWELVNAELTVENLSAFLRMASRPLDHWFSIQSWERSLGGIEGVWTPRDLRIPYRVHGLPRYLVCSRHSTTARRTYVHSLSLPVVLSCRWRLLLHVMDKEMWGHRSWFSQLTGDRTQFQTQETKVRASLEVF